VFTIELAGISRQSNFVNGLLTVMPQTNIAAIRKTDLIIIPAIKGEFRKPDKENTLLVNWIREQYKNGAELEYIEHNFYNRISFEDLSKKLAVGRRNFDRRFIKTTGNTPVEYWQRVKIESAKKALETTRKTVNEIMYETGYSDTKAICEVFRKITGLSPLEYRNKYNKEVKDLA
jgi:transcriptional regulator GlxA family with amidase domain